MCIEEQYRRIRNRIRRLNCRDSFYVTWAYAQYLQIRDFQIPRDIEVNPQFLAIDPPQAWIAEWTLEQIAREIIMHGDPVADFGHSLRQWATLADIINALRHLENDIYARMSSPENIHLELMRISHRQFIWQQHRPVSRSFIRYYKLFNRPDIDPICRDTTGLSVEQVLLIGCALIGMFLTHPRTLEDVNVEIPGLTPDDFNRFLRFTSLPLNELNARLREEHSLDESYAYRYSSLRQFPLVRIRHAGQREIACPIPTLLFWRITSGLYYELTPRPEFFNAFGRSFQDYVGEVLAKRILAPGMAVLPETEYRDGRQRKDTVDWIIRHDDRAALFIECKTMRLTWDSKAGLVDLTRLERDIRKLAGAIVQVYRTIQDYRAGFYPTLPFDPQRSIYPSVITLEDWYLFGHALPERLDVEVRSLLAQRQLPLDWIEEMPYSVMSIDEFEKASGIINVVGVEPFISGKVRDPERRRWAYHSYCNDRYRNELQNLPRLFEDEYDAVFDRLQQQASQP